MQNNKIGIFLLSGLIIGTMLGSGIILLPPIAYDMLSYSAIYAWIGVFITGTIFASIFTKIGIDFPGDAGIANAVEHAFGKEYKNLTALFLIFAVLMGAVAILLLGAEYINMISPYKSLELYALILLVLCITLLLKNIASLSKVTFVLSIIITVTLLIASIIVLLNYELRIDNIDFSQYKVYSKAILILFWSMVGWEIIANYSEDVINPKKTIPIAVIISFITVTIIFSLVVLALQSIDITSFNAISGKISLAYILIPAFGHYAVPIMSLITIALCISTYIMFVGGVARLISAQAKDGYFPYFLSKKSTDGVPKYPLIFLCLIQLFIILLVYFKLINLKQLVEFANLFFICNAMFGIVAAMKIYRSVGFFIASSILIIIFILLLMSSSKILLLIVFAMLLFTIIKSIRRKKLNS